MPNNLFLGAQKFVFYLEAIWLQKENSDSGRISLKQILEIQSCGNKCEIHTKKRSSNFFLLSNWIILTGIALFARLPIFLAIQAVFLFIGQILVYLKNTSQLLPILMELFIKVYNLINLISKHSYGRGDIIG